MNNYIVDESDQAFYENITISNDNVYSGTRNFSLQVQGSDGSDEWIEICIWDDDPGEL